MIDSRPIPDGIRRRRECLHCTRRFTTHERIVPLEVRVIKSGNRPQEDFQAEKIEAALRKVCKGRPVSPSQIDDLVRRIEADLAANGQATIASWEIARQVADLLGELDEVSRFRFLSNYMDANGQVRLGGEERPRERRGAVDQLDLFG